MKISMHRENQGKLGGKEGGTHDRNGGGEGNCLLLVEATQKLRPKESKGASRLAEDYPRMRGYVLEAQRQGRATPWATESHHGEPLLASGITAFFSRL